MCMGKGGVGKTTTAAAIAVALAARGHDVHLSTTDPAAHFTETLQGDLENLTVTRIDPAEATRNYREHVLATKGAHLDEQRRAGLAEDSVVSSPARGGRRTPSVGTTRRVRSGNRCSHSRPPQPTARARFPRVACHGVLSQARAVRSAGRES